MPNMSYCRHENTANDLADVVENWVNSHGYNPEGERVNLDEYETAGRARLIEMVTELYHSFVEDGIVTEDGEIVNTDTHVWSDEEMEEGGGDW